jgi:hypothetical protein
MAKFAMHSTLDRFLNPDSYHPEAVARVCQSEVNELATSLSIVRLCVELRKSDMDTATTVVNHLMKQPPLGYELFQLTTARMIIARTKNDKAAFIHALDAWLKGRAETPANWDDKILNVSAFQPWLSEVDPDKLKPVKVEFEKMSDEDLSFVKDADAIPLKAVLANLDWLRQMNFIDTPEVIAKQFHLTHVNRYLKEATFDHSGDGPGFTIALDENGNYVYSFLSH